MQVFSQQIPHLQKEPLLKAKALFLRKINREIQIHLEEVNQKDRRILITINQQLVLMGAEDREEKKRNGIKNN